MIAVLRQLGLRLCVRLSGDHNNSGKDDQAVRITPLLLGAIPEVSHSIRNDLCVRAADKNALCMFGGEPPPLGGRVGLKQDGRSLRRGLTNVVALHSKIISLMVNFMNLL